MSYGTNTPIGEAMENLEENVAAIKTKILSGEYKKEDVLEHRRREIMVARAKRNSWRLKYLLAEYEMLEKALEEV